MKVAVGSDHRGYAGRESVLAMLAEMGIEGIDFGAHNKRSCDYTDTAYKTAKAVASGEADRGILICGSGIGMSIAANKVNGVRAALCYTEMGAQMSRKHNDANVLCLGSDVIGEDLLNRIVKTWLETEFEGGGRHSRRVEKIAMIEAGKDPNTL